MAAAVEPQVSLQGVCTANYRARIVKLHFWTLLFALFCCTSTVIAQQNGANSEIFEDHSIISRDYLVVTGDTFRKIAKRQLGQAGLAQSLAEYNGLLESAPLAAGQIVRIPIHVPPRKEFAQVIFLKGSVLVQRALKKDNTVTDDSISVGAQHSQFSDVQMVPLDRNSEVYPGDLIDTGNNGFASIEFSSGSVVNLQPNTEAQINRLNCQPMDDSCVIDIKTLRGKVTSNVKSREDQPVDFRITTPYASAAVRGTVFDIEADPSNLLVGVTEGLVDISTNASDQAIELDLGFGSIVKQGQAPGEPIALLPSPVFKRIPARLAIGDTINWWPNTQATKYGALISTDAAGRDALSVSETSSQQIGFNSLDVGYYFLTVRAIDKNGLRGFKSTSRITIAEIDESIGSVETNISKQGSEYLVEIANPLDTANGYEVQISEDQSFNDPLSVDIAPSGIAVFRIGDDGQVFTRARILMDPFTVSAFGATAESN